MKRKILFVMSTVIIFTLYLTIVKGIEQSKKNDESSNSSALIKSIIEEKPWYTASYSGIKISTPERLVSKYYPLTENQKSIMSKIDAYQFTDGSIVVNLIYMKFNNEFIKNHGGYYNFEVGMKNSIANTVNLINGTNLTFNFVDSQDNYNKRSSGTFNVKGINMQYIQVGHKNDAGEIGAIDIYGPGDDKHNHLILKISNSISYYF